MEFATLDGKLVQSGGMVVKNVAGLDMGKLMIGSFGTLAVITSANFKLTPIPEASAVWVLSFADLSSAVGCRREHSQKRAAASDARYPKPCGGRPRRYSWMVCRGTGGRSRCSLGAI